MVDIDPSASRTSSIFLKTPFFWRADRPGARDASRCRLSGAENLGLRERETSRISRNVKVR
jgi:hypothetical protein